LPNIVDPNRDVVLAGVIVGVAESLQFDHDPIIWGYG
jgi:phage shock protein PspC (stress-responsive transcriptional regulator)